MTGPTTAPVTGVDGAAVRVLRVRDGQSSTAFARAIGIGLPYLSDIEAGRRNLKRNPALIKRMAEELRVPMSMLLRRSEVVA